MKRHEQSFRKFLDQSFARFRKLPPAPVDPAWERVLDRLQEEPDAASEAAQSAIDSVRPIHPLLTRRPIWVAAAAAVVAAVVLSVVLWPNGAPALVESVDAGLYRVVEGNAQPLRVNERLEMGETIHSNGGSGGVLVLADGSRVEMRSQSELSLERADDGVRIRLAKGGVIVNAAKQRTGRHLYVQTKDVIVSVVGTVFFVTAEREGSRVVVIEGEVRVQQESGRSQKVLPGRQVATNPLMEPRAATEEVSWSRNAGVHLAMLQQSALTDTTLGKEAPDSFEEISIRPSSSSSATLPGARGGGNGAGGPCPIPGLFSIQTDPSRFVVSNTTVYTLIAFAYGKDCGVSAATGLVTGGPDWIRSDRFDIQASIPAGSFSDTPLVRDPSLQRMIQTLLKSRFNLLLRAEMKEIPAYELIVLESGKIKLSADQTPWTTTPPRLSCKNRGPGLGAPASPMSSLARALSGWFGRPVIDKTNLPGLFDICLEFELDTDGSRRASPSVPIVLSSVLTNLQEQLGLKLQSTRTSVELLVIERIEKPSEN